MDTRTVRTAEARAGSTGTRNISFAMRQSHFQARKIEDTGKRTREVSTIFVASKRQLPISPVGSEARTPATDTESLKSEQKAVGNWAVVQDKQQRELSPIQYNTMQDSHDNTLERATQRLRGQIENLQRRRRLVSTVRPAIENVWNVALEYFQAFRNGLQTGSKPSRSQFEFLRIAMAPDMVFNTGRGPEAMVKTWKCISLWFQDVELELEGMDKGSTGSIVATTITRITITERSLRNVFPHLWVQSGRYKELAEKLLGQRIVMRGAIQFNWDSTQRRVSSVIAQSDLLRPMLGLVGSLENVSRVFEKATISPNFQWRSSAH
ncbi:hypothetical protein GN244_ATG06051 [Phytophthora infestans]|uniref:Bzip transcription factor n=1 Tax=Phytophthora infestans TaxID=4787 RepID=A0A833SW60_PHYIN|nr:hypothetical protein GN244_ATG06051 [Phytophthora infestans]